MRLFHRFTGKVIFCITIVGMVEGSTQKWRIYTKKKFTNMAVNLTSYFNLDGINQPPRLVSENWLKIVVQHEVEA